MDFKSTKGEVRHRGYGFDAGQQAGLVQSWHWPLDARRQSVRWVRITRRSRKWEISIECGNRMVAHDSVAYHARRKSGDSVAYHTRRNRSRRHRRARFQLKSQNCSVPAHFPQPAGAMPIDALVLESVTALTVSTHFVGTAGVQQVFSMAVPILAVMTSVFNSALHTQYS